MNTTNNIATNKDYLETWEFSPIEWNAFIKTARSLKKEDNIYYSIAILIGGIPILMMARNTTFLMASAFVLPFAILIPWLSNKFSTSYLKPTSSISKVAFYSEYLTINHKKIILFTDKKWIKGMKIIRTESTLPLLEIEIAWRTRKGDTFDELRVPIPLGKIERAEALIEYYKFYK
ncbi:MAG: hypothetical protein Q7U59_00330 [Lutibacter sp.]|nr:hypothetical protein [Lutibacter sp.]MDP2067425.1 hypothetical protein [Lutibacter sp.]